MSRQDFILMSFLSDRPSNGVLRIAASDRTTLRSPAWTDEVAAVTSTKLWVNLRGRILVLGRRRLIECDLVEATVETGLE
jgi:hypothetical protein